MGHEVAAMFVTPVALGRLIIRAACCGWGVWPATAHGETSTLDTPEGAREVIFRASRSVEAAVLPTLARR